MKDRDPVYIKMVLPSLEGKIDVYAVDNLIEHIKSSPYTSIPN